MLVAKREFSHCLVVPNHDVDLRRFVIWRPSDPVCSWIIPVLPTAFDQLPQSRSPRLRRGSVCVRNLRLLCWTTQAADCLVRVRMALVNARSAVNKTFILNDFFTSRSLEFLFVTETWFTARDVSPFSELLPGNCKCFNSPRMVRRGGGLATIFKENFSCRALKTDAYNSFELQLLALGSVNPLVIALIYRPPKPHKDFF